MPPRWRIPHVRKTATALLVAATITVAAFSIGQRADHPGYPDTAVIQTDATATPTESGMVNPWAAGDAAVARYFTELGRACFASGPTIEASPDSPPPQDQPAPQPPACCP
jgi:hypothetical protein